MEAPRVNRIVLFGDGAWAEQSLIQIVAEGYCVAAVVVRSRPSDPGLAHAARSLGVRVLSARNVNEPGFLDCLRALAPDLNLSISFDQIARRPLIDLAPLGFVNFHAGKLPQYRGRNVINWAIINGETRVGMTAHFIDEGVDSGDIILQRTVPVAWMDTYKDVLERVVRRFPRLVLDTLAFFRTGNVPRRPQNHAEATYFCGREDGDEWLDWSDTSRHLHNKVRAIAEPAPGAKTVAGDRIVTVWKAFYDPHWPRYIATPGQVVGRGCGVFVKTGDSVLLLRETQVDGEPRTTPNWRVGTRLGSMSPIYA